MAILGPVNITPSSYNELKMNSAAESAGNSRLL